MEVTFTKFDRRYRMSIDRSAGPVLAPRFGPGFDERMPHDGAHLLVEVEADINGGVFGRIAAGASNLFWPDDPGLRRKAARNTKKATPQQRADMAFSEQLASTCVPAWQLDRGHRHDRPEWLTSDRVAAISPTLMERIFSRFDAFAGRWHSLGHGGSITIEWPTGNYR